MQLVHVRRIGLVGRLALLLSSCIQSLELVATRLVAFQMSKQKALLSLAVLGLLAATAAYLFVTAPNEDIASVTFLESNKDRSETDTAERTTAQGPRLPDAALDAATESSLVTSAGTTQLPEEVPEYNNSDYLAYDIGTLIALAENRDPIALRIASMRADEIDLESRERLVLLAAENGDFSGFVRMFFEFSPEADNRNADPAKAFGYLFAATELVEIEPGVADLSAFENLTDNDQQRAREFAQELTRRFDRR